MHYDIEILVSFTEVNEHANSLQLAKVNKCCYCDEYHHIGVILVDATYGLLSHVQPVSTLR